jgi:N-acetylglucosaminyldiphosphoundecaprenol N-acetyl-beta-D-mannosaminyltransferase
MTAPTTDALRSAEPHVLFGFDVAPLTLVESVSLCRAHLASRERLLVGVLNAAKVVTTRRDLELRQALVECDVILADGQSVVWASKVLGAPLPERVTGIDLCEALLAEADRDHLGVYLLGATQEVMDALVATISVRWPSARVCGARDGYFDEDEAAGIAAEIAASRPDMLFIGVPSPTKERFLATYGPSLGVPILHGVGGSFDVIAGFTERAPERWQRLGLEWLFRIRQEPRRLWRRYARTNPVFVAMTFRERWKPTPPYRQAHPSPVRRA